MVDSEAEPIRVAIDRSKIVHVQINGHLPNLLLPRHQYHPTKHFLFLSLSPGRSESKNSRTKIEFENGELQLPQKPAGTAKTEGASEIVEVSGGQNGKRRFGEFSFPEIFII